MKEYLLSHLAETLIGSEIVKLGNAISDRIRKGEKIYNYTIGDFDPALFPIPSQLETLIIESYKEKNTNYPTADGVIELRESVSSFLKLFEGIDYLPSEIQIACGGRPLIYTAFRAIVDKGDKVIYAAPSWNNNHYVHMTEAVHCIVDCKPENNFMPRAKDIAPYIQDASLLCLCTPQNPTGTTLIKSELEQICELVIAENNRRSSKEKKLYVLFDQIYWLLTYGTTEHFNPVLLNPEMKQYTIFVDGITKAFASTGVRVGWSLGPEHVIAKMRAILSHLRAWAPMAEQKAVAKFLQQTETINQYIVDFKQGIEQRLHAIYSGFIALKEKGFSVDAITPQAAIYLTVKIDLVGKQTDNGGILLTQTEVTSYILAEAKLAIVPFSAFGAKADSPWYRVSVGTCRLEDVNDVFEKLEAALQKLY